MHLLWLKNSPLILADGRAGRHVFFSTKTDKWVKRNVGKKSQIPATSSSDTDQQTWILSPSCMHTHTQTACKQFCPHGTQQHSQMRKQITWLMGVLMTPLTLMRKGTCSWRQLTLLIIEISHRYNTLCCRVSHWFSLDPMCLYLHLESCQPGVGDGFPCSFKCTHTFVLLIPWFKKLELLMVQFRKYNEI